MINGSALRIALGAGGVSIWSSAIFGADEPSRLRDFLSRAFAVEEVEAVDLRRTRSFGRIRYGAVANPSQIWKKLGRALSSPDVSPDAAPKAGSEPSVDRVDAGHLYLDAPGRAPLSIHRVGNVLSTWRVQQQSPGNVRLTHPVLRRRRDVLFRLEEELASLIGVEAFRASAITGGVSIRFDPSATTVERLARDLEQAWPRLLDGLDGPPSQKRLVSAVGLLGLATTGQYFIPAVRPIALAGMAIYSVPNVVNAGKQLTRGEVGIAALYTTGLGFMLAGGMPFAASLFATLMQLWPNLAHRKVVSSQRRLFAAQRRVPGWARVVGAEGVDVEVNVDRLQKGDRIVIRTGDVIPIDGVVEEGAAAVLERDAFGGRQILDVSRGDAVVAGALVRDGSLTVRLERAGEQTIAGRVSSLLPHTPLTGLPSAIEAERVANRNAKPALALAAISFFFTRTLLPAQAVIRPDYATAPRLSAQLSALRAVAVGLRRGVLFRTPAALDRLSAVDHIVIDESAGLGRRSLQVVRVEAVKGVSAEHVVSQALAAQPVFDHARRQALATFASKLRVPRVKAEALRRSAGVARYRDRDGTAIEVATRGYLTASSIEVPQRFQTTLSRRTRAPLEEVAPSADEPAYQPLWVLRDGHVIGVVSFARTGEIVGRRVVAAIAARNEKARVVHVSRRHDAGARQLARTLGIGFSSQATNQLVTAAEYQGRAGARETLWVGDGSTLAAAEARAAGSIVVSVSPLSSCSDDAADVLLSGRGLAGLPDLLELGQAHATRLANDYKTVYIVNLLAVAGAIFAGMSGLQSGLLSNAGTGLIYARHAVALDWLAAAAENRSTRLTS